MKFSPTLLLAVALAPLPLAAQTTGAFAQAGVSYLYGAPSGTPLYQTNTTGADVQASITADTSYNGFEQAYAAASLATGALKARSGGTATNINSNATVSFGDTFGALDAQTGRGHAWTMAESVHFSFQVTGAFQHSLSAERMTELDTDFHRWAGFSFTAYRPGAFALMAQLDAVYAGPFTSDTLAEIGRLGAQIDALQITRSFTYLGRPYSAWFDGSASPYINLSADTPSVIGVDFNPGGTFEWRASLDVMTRFQPDQLLGERSTLVADFSHTVGASFSGPAGTITASASGLFPSTVQMQPVPEPGTWALWLSALLMLPAVARRRGRHCA